MLHIQNYLINNSLEQLNSELFIKVKRHNKYPNLIGLCYSQLESPKLHPIVKEARGLILDSSNNWKIVAYGLNRFLNYKEGGADEIDWSTALTMTKLDGSLIQIYYYNNQWLVATKGSPNASGTVHDYGFTFNHLAWKIFYEEGYNLTDLHPSYTYCFELCTPYNKVVVPHIKNSLTLLSIRNNITLKEVTLDPSNILCRPFNLVKYHNLSNWEDILKSIEKLNGHEHEGYVVVDANFNRVKIKHPAYVALSHLKEGLTKRRLLEIVRQNEGEEFLNYFPELQTLYLEIKCKYDNLINAIEQTWSKYQTIENQKEFALLVKDYNYSGLLFSLKRKQISSVKEGLSQTTIQTLEKLLEC